MLRDVGGEFTEGGRVERGGVEEDAAVGRGGAGGEDVKEGGFSGSAWADDGEDLRRVGCESYVLENVGWFGASGAGFEPVVRRGRGGGGFGVGD